MSGDRNHPSYWRQRAREAVSRADAAPNAFAAAYWRRRARAATEQYQQRVSAHRATLTGQRKAA